MSFDNYKNDTEKALEEQRRKKAAQFKLKIDSETDNFDDLDDTFESSELTSYSGEDVREQIERDSKHALKKKKKEEKKEQKAKNKHNRRIFRIMWIISVVIVGAAAGMFLITGINDMLAISRTDSSTVQLDIPQNPDLDKLIEELDKKGIINEPTYFKMFAYLTKSTDDFTQGTYQIRKNMDYEAIINYLLSSSNRTDTVSVTILEGENAVEIANTLEKKGALSDKDKFLEMLASDKYDEDFDFLASIKNADNRYYKLEGYLYPDTYEFYVNEEPETIIYKFLNNYETKVNEKRTVDGYEKKTSIVKMLETSNTGYSLDEAMIVASIIQAEAANVEDMYYISSILYNRLNADADLGVSTLGLDSTRFYPYRTAEDVPDSEGGSGYVSRYDTYDKIGLPAGAICNPGMDAMIAALNPNSTNYYFFCHDSKGTAYYAETLYGQESNLEYIESYDN